MLNTRFGTRDIFGLVTIMIAIVIGIMGDWAFLSSFTNLPMESHAALC